MCVCVCARAHAYVKERGKVEERKTGEPDDPSNYLFMLDN